MVRVYAAILAGGSSKRFEGDKLLADYKGKAVIRRVCEAVAEVVDGVYLCCGSEERSRKLRGRVNDLIEGALPDSEKIRCGGPLRGIGTAGIMLDCDFLLTLPADVPNLNADAIRRFVGRSLKEGADASGVVWGMGMVDSLIQFQERQLLEDSITMICRTRAGIARPTDLLRGAKELLLVHARNLVDDPRIFSNINKREDLISPKPRGVFGGDVQDDLFVRLATQRREGLFWLGCDALENRNLLLARELYAREGKFYSRRGIHHLAGHCYADASFIAKRAGRRGEALAMRRLSKDSLNRMG